MTPEQWEKIKNIVADALKCDAGERDAYLQSACGTDHWLRAEVESLLAKDSGDHVLQESGRSESLLGITELVDTVPYSPDAQASPKALPIGGRRLGPYEVHKQIGEGGMGSVFLASRADRVYEKQVAVKILRPSPAWHAVSQRFRQECRILASLDHPNVARLFDAGTTDDGLPYFVMEYVDGEPIDAWCDRRKLRVSQRLELFKVVCDTVHYAHQHQVIHRDLKPGNILVTADGTPKLLDFGIAKVLHPGGEDGHEMTHTGPPMMTPAYASPEQIRGEPVTTATDTYALGVILYQLLTGRQPYKLRSWKFYEFVRAICEEAPVAPSEAVDLEDEKSDSSGALNSAVERSRIREGSPADLRRRLKGDVDTVVRKSLSKDPRARYSSAKELGDDIASHLAGQPILARPEGLLRGLGRILYKRRTELLTAVVLIIGVTTGAIQVKVFYAVSLLIGMAMLGMWRGATDPKLGRWLDEKLWSKVLRVLVVGGVVAFLAGLFGTLGARLSLRLMADSSVGSVPVIFLAILLSSPAFVLAWILSSEISWLRREKIGGRLLVAAKGEAPPTPLIFLLTAIWLLSLIWFIPSSRGAARIFLASSLPLLAVLIPYYYISSVMEVRQNGLMISGRLYPWSRIESYRWGAATSMWSGRTLDANNYRKFTITMRRKILRILPSPSTVIAQECAADVEGVVTRFLSEWPEAASSCGLPQTED